MGFIKSLNQAKKMKKDEFYTLYKDIEKELKNYKSYFNNKKVFINCDNPSKSQFWQFFKDNFDEYGLKKLTAMYYQPEGKVYKHIIEEGKDLVGVLRCKQIPLKGNGSYDSEESLEILKESDVVVTNPPFSKWIDYVKVLMEYEKDFLILGRQTSMGYKDIYPLVRDNKMWTGTESNKVKEFKVPEEYQEEGKEIVKVSSISWYTNIEHPLRHKYIELTAEYKVEDYETFDNYPAINVNSIKAIPKDYKGIMGVPITILNNFNHEQFEIKGFRYGEDGKGLRVNGKEKFTRVLIKNKKYEDKVGGD